jgi:hypothetical protein
MTVIVSQLVASKALQQFLVDKDTGLPLSSGRIDIYKDNNRLERKNWFYKSGTPSAGYSYVPLANPMTLSGAGALVDPSGNEINPYYYPFSEDSPSDTELYYIEVYNSAGTFQFTRQGFPPVEDSSDVNEISTYQNLIVNNRFWQAGGPKATFSAESEPTINCTNETNIVICPSKHNGLYEPDIRFKKSKTGANDHIEFARLPVDLIDPDDLMSKDVNPEFYINATCTAPTTGESFKYIQIPIALNIRNLEGKDAILTVQAKRAEGANNVPISFSILKFLGYKGFNLGTGDVIESGITLPTNWLKKSTPFSFANFAAPETISATKDDAYYLQINLPQNTNYDIQIALPSIFLGDTAPTNDFDSYDKASSIIFSPRTGDFRQSLNYFYNFGWVPANNGSISNQGNGGTLLASSQAWPLFKLLWDNVSQLYATIQDSSGTTQSRGESAYDDFIINNRRITLTQNLGHVLAGANPVWDFNENFTINLTPTNSSAVSTTNYTMTFADLGDLQTGDIVYLATTGTLPGGLSINTPYYISVLSGTTVAFHKSLYAALNDYKTNPWTNRIRITSSGSGTQSIANNDLTITLTTAPSTQLKAGTPIILSTSGSLPGQLSVNSVYYISSRSTSASEYKLSSSYERAVGLSASGHCVNWSAALSGTATISSALGAVVGESLHTQTTNELAEHRHQSRHDSGEGFFLGDLDVPPNNNKSSNAGGADSYVKDGLENEGANVAMNNMQLTSFANVYIKL